MVSLSPYWPLIGREDAAIRKTLAETRDIQVTGAGKAALVVIAVGGSETLSVHNIQRGTKMMSCVMCVSPKPDMTL